MKKKKRGFFKALDNHLALMEIGLREHNDYVEELLEKSRRTTGFVPCPRCGASG